MKIGLQLYTLRKQLFTGDPAAVLSRVAEMGYDGVEWFGLLPGYDAEKTCRITKEAGLEFFSLHTDVNGLKNADSVDWRFLAEAGVRYAPIGWLPEDNIAGGPLFAETIEAIRGFASAVGQYGIRVLYHNHDFDLAGLPDGSAKLDRLYEALPASVLGAELDTCWVYSGGADPLEYVRKYADRTPILHLKDCIKEGGRKGYMPVGYGVLNFRELIPAARAEWFCVEQDEPTPEWDEWTCVKKSLEFLKENF